MTDTPGMLTRGGAVLVVIDVQDRINQAMADQRHVPRIVALLRAFRALALPVIATEQYPKGLGPTLAEVAAAIEGPMLEKMSFSCAREPGFRRALEHLGRRQVVLAGIESHVCVAQTALDLVHAGFEVHVPHDAVNSRRPADRAWSLRRLARSGVTVTTTESALFELLERCGTDDFRAVSRLIKDLPVEPSPQ